MLAVDGKLKEEGVVLFSSLLYIDAGQGRVDGLGGFTAPRAPLPHTHTHSRPIWVSTSPFIQSSDIDRAEACDRDGIR